MNRNEIIQNIIDTNLLETCVDYQLKKQPQHYTYRDDIINDAWVWLLTYNERKLINAAEGKHLNALITRYLQNQIFSKTSDYYRKYIRYDILSDDLDGIKDLEDC